MLKLYDIFLRKFILIFVSIFLIVGGITYYWVKNLYIDQVKLDLLHNIDILITTITTLEDANKLAINIKDKTNIRVTIIASNGMVIGDSDENYKNMDNHINRDEIIQAQYQKYGESTRYSNTLQKELLYISKQFDLDSQQYYLRMSKDINAINEAFQVLVLKVFIVLIISLLILFYIALYTSKNIQNETNKILRFLNDLESQKKAKKIESNYSLEFHKITNLLSDVSYKLIKKDKEKEKKNKQLKILNQQKDDIIAAISHEFKNPIAVINGYSQLIVEDQDITSSMREKFLNKILSNAKKISNMIDRLRLSVQLEQGKQELQKSSCNITKLTQSIISDLKDLYPNRIIFVEFTNEKIEKEIDVTVFSVAIKNIIENALKYSNDDISVKVSNSYIEVKDKGIGLSTKDIGMVTSKFYRVSSNDWNNSMGVGLSLVKSIIDLHKFKLEIKSEKGEGSTFSIVF